MAYSSVADLYKHLEPRDENNVIRYNEDDMDNVTRYKLIDQTTKDICIGFQKSYNIPQIVTHLIVLYYAKTLTKDEQTVIRDTWNQYKRLQYIEVALLFQNSQENEMNNEKSKDKIICLGKIDLYRAIRQLGATSITIDYDVHLFTWIDQCNHGDVSVDELILWVISSAKRKEERVVQNKLFQKIVEKSKEYKHQLQLSEFIQQNLHETVNSVKQQ
eukprot:468912_1